MSGQKATGPRMRVTLNVNGQNHDIQLDPRTTLLDALREHLGLTGTKWAATTAPAVPAPSMSMAAASSPA